HGAEGYLGSAVQLDLLSKLREVSIPAGTTLLLVHALNPWGFSHCRRVNEENVDLNRSFHLPGTPLPEDPPHYRKLNHFLHPTGQHLSDFMFLPQAVWNVARYGLRPLQHAISSGQHSYPQGLFWQGNQPSWTMQQWDSYLDRFAPEVVLHIDFHTGLGKSGTGQIMTGQPLSEKQRAWLVQTTGDNLWNPTSPEETISGTFDNWMFHRFAEAGVISVCAELGTEPPIQMLQALRYENWATFHGSEATRIKARQKLKNAFCPTSAEWRNQALQISRNWLHGMLQNLSSFPAKS
ncbi:MAG: DUF2817 domain-containing protein, partial [Planctomycetaceae bacterium]|nr:DUF2817 domain-containing protein [Planctomycetaceae bacterium]